MADLDTAEIRVMVPRLINRSYMISAKDAEKAALYLAELCDEVERLREALALIGAMGYSSDPAVNANIARMAVQQAREARAASYQAGGA